MPASRHVRNDIAEKGLDPSIPYHEIGKDGRLTGREDPHYRGREMMAQVDVSFEAIEARRGGKPTGQILEAKTEVVVVEDGVVTAAAEVEVSNVPVVTAPDSEVFTPEDVKVASGDSSIPDEGIVLASSKKIKAKKAEKAAAEKPAEKPVEKEAEKPAE